MKIYNIIKKYHNFYLLLILLLIPFLKFIIPFSFDNDFWFTINQGKYVIDYTFPTKAINLIHDFDFLYQSWGSGVLFYLIYNYLGNYGIISLLIIISLLTNILFYNLFLIISNNKRISLIISIITMFLYNMIFLTTRPHIFTTLNLVIMLYLLESFVKTNKNKYLYFLPIISLLEINMHGIYLIVLLLIY